MADAKIEVIIIGLTDDRRTSTLEKVRELLTTEEWIVARDIGPIWNAKTHTLVMTTEGEQAMSGQNGMEFYINGATAMGLGMDTVARTRKEVHEKIDEFLDKGCTVITLTEGRPGAP